MIRAGIARLRTVKIMRRIYIPMTFWGRCKVFIAAAGIAVLFVQAIAYVSTYFTPSLSMAIDSQHSTTFDSLDVVSAVLGLVAGIFAVWWISPAPFVQNSVGIHSNFLRLTRIRRNIDLVLCLIGFCVVASLLIGLFSSANTFLRSSYDGVRMSSLIENGRSLSNDESRHWHAVRLRDRAIWTMWFTFMISSAAIPRRGKRPEREAPAIPAAGLAWLKANQRAREKKP